MTAPAITHHTFTLERRYPQPPAKVFRAFADAASKRRWMVEGDGFTVESHSLDFRVQGWERSRFRFHGGPLMTNDSVHLDIVENRRIVVAYAMAIGGKPLSASLLSVELFSDGGGTRLVLTEQGQYFDAPDHGPQREEGTRGLLERLAVELERNR